MIRTRLTKNQILTIPNAMSLFRLLLIPLYLWLYCGRENYAASIAVIALSMLTDLLDGKIARRFNMVSDVGKVLDPIADKLTQAALLLSLCTRYRLLLGLFVLFAVKELTMLILGGIVLKKTDTINSAKWYGKLATAVLELSLALLILFPQLPALAVDGIIVGCGAVMLFALTMYVLFYLSLLHAHSGTPHEIHWLRVIAVVSWAVLIAVAFACRDWITVDSVLNYTPQSKVLAVLFLMLLYALKSVCVVIYIGILYLVDALLFPVPAAMAVSMAGTLVAVTVPYLLGCKLGASGAEQLAQKHERLAMLHRMQTTNDFLFSLISRLMLFLPSDLVSFYMGAARLSYGKYLLGCTVGFAPLVVLFTLMGDSIGDLHSPQLWVTGAVVVVMTVASLLLFGAMAKQQGREPKEKQSTPPS